MQEDQLDRLVQRYFNETERRISITKGTILLNQEQCNDRLYYVISGELNGYLLEENKKQIQVFSASAGSFIGVHSFFSGSWVASSTVIAQTDAKLAWIDRLTPAFEPGIFGPLNAQFMPVIVSELSYRQRRVAQEAKAKEKVLQKLHLAEQMTTLGQLAAGLAHELNNTIGVVSSKSERLESIIFELLEKVNPSASQFFDFGLLTGQTLTSKQVRSSGRDFELRYDLPKGIARELARAVPDNEPDENWLINPQEAIHYWQIGRDLHDLRMAAHHTVGIVQSVKQLGRADTETEAYFDLNESINQALILLQGELRLINVLCDFDELPAFWGSQTELVQVWINLVKNACDVLKHHEKPCIEIKTRKGKSILLITITNNGEEINPLIKRKIFQPNFTTKKGGLSFGLGLGLSIVKRIVLGYQGSITVKSDPDKTAFRIKLPIEGEHG